MARITRLVAVAPPEFAPSAALTWSSVGLGELGDFTLLHNQVGAPYGSWSERAMEHWIQRLSGAAVHLGLLELAGLPVGISELAVHPGGDVELASFGLAPDFLGRKLGRAALLLVLEQAWKLGRPTRRVWLTTSSQDHPRALPLYLSVGFEMSRAVDEPAGDSEQLTP